MKKLNLKKIFNTPIKNMPVNLPVSNIQSLIKLSKPKTAALLPSKIPFIKPALLVHENDKVSIGTPLFYDKRDSKIKFLSPAGGIIKKIIYGKKRAVDEIIIELDSKLDSKEERVPIFDEIEFPLNIEPLSYQEIIDILIQAGLWQTLKQFPFMDIADYNSPIPMIIVSLHPQDIYSPPADIILNDRENLFILGLSVLKRLSKKIVVSAPQYFIEHINQFLKYSKESEYSEQLKHSKKIKYPELLKYYEELKNEITHINLNSYPAGDPGVILYQVKKEVSQNRSATIHPQDVIAIGELFFTGHLSVDRIYTITGNLNPKENKDAFTSNINIRDNNAIREDNAEGLYHIIARAGSPIEHLVGAVFSQTEEVSLQKGIITGGLFTGSTNKNYSHIGSSEYSVIIIDKSPEDKFFGFLSFNDNSIKDINFHGEERACINCGFCDKKCPVDIMPQFIMKAYMAGEIEEVVSLGLLDCTLCGLCSFVCPSKIDITHIMDNAKYDYYKDCKDCDFHA